MEVLKCTKLHLASFCLEDLALHLACADDPAFTAIKTKYANVLCASGAPLGLPPDCSMEFELEMGDVPMPRSRQVKRSLDREQRLISCACSSSTCSNRRTGLDPARNCGVQCMLSRLSLHGSPTHLLRLHRPQRDHTDSHGQGCNPFLTSTRCLLSMLDGTLVRASS